MADWYDQYALIYSRLRKRAPRSYHPYSAAGADALGVRQSHGVPFGTDHLLQPDFVALAAFGDGARGRRGRSRSVTPHHGLVSWACMSHYFEISGW